MSQASSSTATARHDRRRDATDPELMHELAGGDLGALGELYDRYHETVRQFLLRACPDAASADDLVHDTFLSVARAASAYDGRARAAPFFIGIAAGLARRRRRGLGRLSVALRAFQESYVEAVSTPETQATVTEDLARIDEALAALSDDKRLVYLMTEREGMSGEEVAAALGIPTGTVWRRLHHARAALQRAVLEGGKR